MANTLKPSAIALVIAAIIAGVLPARARQQPVASRLVLASVTDAQGRPLVDVDPDEFVVSESGERCEVVAAYDADYPVVVLIDNSADTRDLEAIRSAVGGFLSRAGERLVAIGTLTNPPALVTSFEDQRPAVLARLGALTASPTSILAPIEAVGLAANAVRQSGSPFSAIVVVAAHSIDPAKPQNTGLLSEIFDSGAVVHVVSRTSPVATPDRTAPRLQADLLRDLADQTRGNFITVFSAPSYGVALNNLADRLGTEMMVEYFAPAANAPGEVQIGVRIPGAHVKGLKVSKGTLQ